MTWTTALAKRHQLIWCPVALGVSKRCPNTHCDFTTQSFTFLLVHIGLSLQFRKNTANLFRFVLWDKDKDITLQSQTHETTMGTFDLTSDLEPTDEQLQALMEGIGEIGRQSIIYKQAVLDKMLQDALG